MIRGVASVWRLANASLMLRPMFLLRRQTIHAHKTMATTMVPATEGIIMLNKRAVLAAPSSELLATGVTVGLVVLAVWAGLEVFEVFDVGFVEVDVGEKCAVEHQEAVESDVIRDVELGGTVPTSDGRGIDQGC
jgi:hypothetical protein